MKENELLEMVKKSDALRAEMGMPESDFFPLVITRPNPPSGYNKIRTPFGLCEIMNVQEKNGGYQTVFRASRKQVLAFVKKLKKQ